MMRQTATFACVLAGLVVAAAEQAREPGAGSARSPAATRSDGGQSAQTSRGDKASRDRGSYLVHDVAMCVQCHSPRNADGELIATRLLQGGTIPLRSPYPKMQWAFRAPRIAGLQGWTEEEFVQLLVTGQTTDGWSPRPPMPSFRMSEQDARAVAAYLKSI